MVLTKKEMFGASDFKTNIVKNEQASPFISFSNDGTKNSPTTITAGSDWLIDLAENDASSQKYLPMTNMRIVNNSNCAIIVFPNQSIQGMMLPSGAVVTFDRSTVPAVYSLKIHNADSSTSIASSELNVTFWKEGIVYDRALADMNKSFWNFVGKRMSR
jgi:hypothetical protein